MELDDLDFLLRVYASSREEEMDQAVHWSDAQKAEFLRGQFELQHRHYQEHYPSATFSVVMALDKKIGRLYVDRWDKEIRLMDVALLPEFRNRGIGEALMRELVAEAERENKLLSCHVEELNSAKRLYERLGFVEAGEHTFYKLMHWSPPELSS
jgi:ribosomal protein S18 acetylase RimI-like enzyme